MNNLRRLRPLILPKSKIKKDPGPPRQPILLKLTQLRINDDYQRKLSKDSTQMAIKITTEFDWELYHLPVVSPLNEVDETTNLPLYEILDGQHTAIAALTNGFIKELWCWPGRPQESLKQRAESFVSLNNQRTSVTAVELFWASVTAGKEEAIDVVEACRRTGAQVVKRAKPYGDMKIGETICVDPLMKLAKAGGVAYVQRILTLAMDLRLAPIGQIWILALKELTLKKQSPHYLAGIPNTVNLQIVNAVGRMGVENLMRTAMATHAGLPSKDRYPAYWTLAALIKKEINDHATDQ